MYPHRNEPRNRSKSALVRKISAPCYSYAGIGLEQNSPPDARACSNTAGFHVPQRPTTLSNGSRSSLGSDQFMPFSFTRRISACSNVATLDSEPEAPIVKRKLSRSVSEPRTPGVTPIFIPTRKKLTRIDADKLKIHRYSLFTTSALTETALQSHEQRSDCNGNVRNSASIVDWIQATEEIKSDGEPYLPYI